MVAQVDAGHDPRIPWRQDVGPARVDLLPLLRLDALVRQEQIRAALAVRAQLECRRAAHVIA